MSRKTCNPKLFKNTPEVGIAELCGFQNSKYDQCLVENKLAKLAQIHIILEHLLLIENNINLSCSAFYFFILTIFKIRYLFCQSFSLPVHHFVQSQLEKSPKPFSTIKPLSLDHITIELNHNQIILNMEE